MTSSTHILSSLSSTANHLSTPSLISAPTPHDILNKLTSLSSSLNPLQLDSQFFQQQSSDSLFGNDPCVNFGPYGIALSIIYMITFCFIVRHCIRNKRPTLERTFIFFILMNNVVRIIYFLGWGIQNHDQCPTVIIYAENRSWLSYFSNIPAHFYITAFSILVYKFSFVFHRIINISSSHRIVSLVVTYVLIIANIISYLVAFASMVQFSWFIDRKYSWMQNVSLNTLIVLSSTLAVLLFLYGNALFFTIQSYLKQVRQQLNQTDGIVAVQCDIANDLRDAQDQLLASHHQLQLSNNPHYVNYQNPQYPLANAQNNQQYHNNALGEYDSNDNYIKPLSQSQITQLDGSSNSTQDISSQQNITMISTSSDQLSASSNQHSSQTSHGTTTKSQTNTQNNSSGHPSSSTSPHSNPQQHSQQPSSIRPNPIVQSGIVQQYNSMRSQQHLQQQQQLQFAGRPQPHNTPGYPQQQQQYSPMNGNQRLNTPNNRNQQSSNQFATMFSKPSPMSKTTQLQNQQQSQQYYSQNNLGGSNNHLSNTSSSTFLDQASNTPFAHNSPNNHHLGGSNDGSGSFSNAGSTHNSSNSNLQQTFLHSNNPHGNDKKSGLMYCVDSSSVRSGSTAGSDLSSRQSNNTHYSQNQQQRGVGNRRIFNTQKMTQQQPFVSPPHLLFPDSNSGILTDSPNDYGSPKNKNGFHYNDETIDSLAPNRQYDINTDEYGDNGENDNNLNGLVHLPGHSYYGDKGLLFSSFQPNSPSTLHIAASPNDSLLPRSGNQYDYRNQRSFSIRDNYMFKPFLVSVCSSMCFVIRVGLLIAMSSFGLTQRPEIILLYSCCAEIIPMHLMWFVFDDPSLDNEGTAIQQQIPTFDDQYDDEQHYFSHNNDEEETNHMYQQFDTNGMTREQYQQQLLHLQHQSRYNEQYQEHTSQQQLMKLNEKNHNSNNNNSPLQTAMNASTSSANGGQASDFLLRDGSKSALSMASTTGESTGLPNEETYSIQASHSNLLSSASRYQ